MIKERRERKKIKVICK